MEHRRRFVLLCFVSALCSVVIVGTFGQKFCDDGHTGVDKDLGGKENYHCADGEHWKMTEGKHASRHECTNVTLLEQAVCMDQNITYPTTPPLGGAYRHLPPKYGEYSYLPPERWVHALVLGGVVFLYHPCAPPKQIAELRDLAKGCLQKHIITPYPQLTKEEPLAIVVWGCVFRMAQVEADAAKAWIREQELSVIAAPSTPDQIYSHDLQTSAEDVSDVPDKVLCPTPAKERQDTSEEDQSSNATVLVHGKENEDPEEERFSRRGIFVGLFAVFCILFVAGLVVAVVLQKKFRWIKSSYKPRKYKFVGSFFPSKDTRTYIPPTGTPKVPGEEQSKLLDSDEEEV